MIPLPRSDLRIAPSWNTQTIRRYIDSGLIRAHHFGPKSLRIEMADLLGLATPAHPDLE